MDYSKKPERKNLRENRNCLSQLLFLWIVPYLWKGSFRGGLNENDDVTKCRNKDRSEILGNRLEDAWEKEKSKAQHNNRKPKLRNALMRSFYRACIVDGILVFIFVFIKTIMPLVLGQLLIQFQIHAAQRLNESHHLDLSEDYIEADTGTGLLNFIWTDQRVLSILLIACVLVACFFSHHTNLRQQMVGARMRIACCSLVYRKTLKLSKKTSGEITVGYIVNLLSNDVGRLDYGFVFMHYIWIMPIQAIFICYLISRETKYAAIVGVLGLLLKTVPVQTGLSKLASIFRMTIAKKTDKRVGIMNELIQGIQVIKMYAWEKPFRKVVKEARKKEVNVIRYASWIRAVYLSTMVIIERSTLFIAIVACVYEGISVTPNIVFSMAQYFNVLQLVAAIFYPLAMSFGAEALVSIKRIEEYLLLEEQTKSSLGLHHNNQLEVIEPETNAIELFNVSASWANDSNRKTLENINLKLKAGKLCGIIGQVGAGKSSLLHLLLGELPVGSGNVIINGDITYASQENFIFNTTVRNNILFGLPYDKERYKETIKYCALLTDFQMLPDGDKTIVGDRGAALSGGQRARVNLARAVYRNSQIILLDDPLSAVDSHVSKFLFDECINGYLAKQKTTRVLVTHQVHLLKEVDWIIVMENGQIKKQGTYKEIMQSDIDLDNLVLNQSDENEDEYLSEHEDDIPFIDGAENKLIKRTNSKIKKTASMSVQSLYSTVSSNDNQGRQVAEDQADTSIPFAVWRDYFLSGAGICFLFLTFLVLIISQCVVSGSDFFVTYWTNQEYLRTLNETTTFTTMDGIYYYGLLILMVIFVTLLRCLLFFSICMKASKVLHSRMFASLLSAPMRFFNQNPTGRILNRFSKDMGAIDELLPKAMMESIQIILVMVGILSIIAIVNPYLMIPLSIAVILFGCVLKLYLRSAQDLKRMEGIKKSPIFNHLSATLNGISTIRASRVTTRVTSEFDQLQNVHSSVYHLMVCSNEALGLWLDIISATFIASVTFSFLYLNEDTASLVGLAVSQSLILTGMVQYGIRQSTESMQQMTCVERVLAYTKLSPEPNPLKKITRDWPWKGLIEFQDMYLYYDALGEPTLKKLTLTIQPAMKIGIVGRTGAGKSSLISALFRLAHIEGKILIDGVDTRDINLENLRSKISIIPQDPVLFSATVRYNLDPFEEHTDEQIWKALEYVELKEIINGLQYMVSEGGSNFSVGQRQLICLARAILRNNKILVLDEATANVDPRTDELIQHTIRVRFKDCTVLTVAHRLHTIMDSDRVLVMDAGEAKEFDIPYRLLQNSMGIFYHMVKATGNQESENLIKIAKDKFNSLLINY